MDEPATAELDWLLAVARPTGAGSEWTSTEVNDDVDPTLQQQALVSLRTKDPATRPFAASGITDAAAPLT